MTKAKKRELTDLAARQYEAGNLDQAEAVCREVLAADARDGEAWFRLGWIARCRGQPDASIEAFRKAIDGDRNNALFHNGLGVALMAAGRLAEAVAAYRKALDLQPASADALANLARAQWLLGDLDAAEAAYRKAVTLAPELAQVRHNFGQLLRSRGKYREAAGEHARAAELAPRNADFHVGLALDLIACRAYSDAADSLTRAAELRPDDADVAAHLAYALYHAKRWTPAIACCEAVLRYGPNPLVRLLLSQSLYHTGAVEAAVAECERVLREAPGWQTGQFFLDQMTSPERVTHLPGEAVAALFDGYADQFDEHLVRHLGYRAPRLLLEAVTATSDAGSGGGLAVLDLGCGTGLCGELFKPHASRLVGVDLSPGMLRKARARGVYDELLVGDLGHALRREAEAYDLVLAADVFLYVGDLDDVFAAARGAMRTGGLLAFTLEAHRGHEPFVLRPSRRFAHSIGYARGLAAKHGLAEVRTDTAALRREEAADVEGLVVVLRK